MDVLLTTVAPAVAATSLQGVPGVSFPGGSSLGPCQQGLLGASPHREASMAMSSTVLENIMSQMQRELLKSFEAKLGFDAEGLLLELGVENAAAIRSAILRSGVGRVTKGTDLLWEYYEVPGSVN
jgi:hypothetical protein